MFKLLFSLGEVGNIQAIVCQVEALLSSSDLESFCMPAPHDAASLPR